MNVPTLREPAVRGLLLLLVVLALPLASAHAVYQSSEPPADGNGPVGLTVLEIRFSEGLERRFTDADVFDLNGTSFKAGPIEFDSNDRQLIRVPLQPLSDGIYSVAWQTLSVDTHTMRGTFLISIGNATLTPSGPPIHDHASDAPSRAEGVARGVFFGGLFAGIGIPLFVARFDRDRPASRALLRAAGAFALVGGVGGLLAFYHFADRTALPFDDAMTTTAGSSLALRGGLLLVAAAAAFAAAQASDARRRAAAFAPMLMGLGALVASSMGSHAASVADGRALAIAADLAHLATAAIWVGGVLGFVLVIKHRSPLEAGRIIGRFSPWAMASVVTIVATGIYAALLHMGSVEELWNDRYGRLVALKALLILPLIAMGAYNQHVLQPRLESGHTGTRRFRSVVQVEAVLMTAIVLMGGMLSTTAPPMSQDEWTGPPRPQPFYVDEFTTTSHVVLYIEPSPPTVGIQSFNVQIHALSAAGVPNSTTVGLKFAAPGEREPDELITPQKITPGDWRLEGGYLTSPGTWKVYVVMQRPDEYKKLVFEVPVVAPGTES